MQVLTFLTAEQRNVIDVAKKYGSVDQAARFLRVSKLTLQEWRKDPDVALALDLAEQQGDADLYMKAIDAVDKNLIAGDLMAAQMVLKAVAPEKWNPAQKLQVEAVAHRFIDFNGQAIHEPLENNSDGQ